MPATQREANLAEVLFLQAQEGDNQKNAQTALTNSQGFWAAIDSSGETDQAVIDLAAKIFANRIGKHKLTVSQMAGNSLAIARQFLSVINA